jgi:hypothetical protein
MPEHRVSIFGRTGSENDIRAQVTRRKVSGGTRNDLGRDCRDAFLALAKTCAKLSIRFWDYLGTRLDIPNQPEILSLLKISHGCSVSIARFERFVAASSTERRPGQRKSESR